MTTRRKWMLVRVALTAVYLITGWVLFTATLCPRSLGLGLGFALLVSALTYGLFIEENEADRLVLIPRLHLMVVYILHLVYKMYVASFRVLWLILRGGIHPRVVHFRTRLKSDIARVILANSITLTPGTIMLTLDDDHLIVHWLDARTTHSRHAGEIIKGSFERLLKRIWI